VNIFIVALVIMALSQTVMSAEGGTLAKAIEVAQQIRADADEAYAKGVARRNERHQWHDATTAVKRIKTRYDLLKLIQSNAQTYYDRHKTFIFHFYCSLFSIIDSFLCIKIVISFLILYLSYFLQRLIRLELSAVHR
jgi:hypothetical protein